MTLYIQLLTQIQTSEAVGILAILATLFKNQEIQGHAKLHAQGKTMRRPVPKLQMLVPDIKTQFNKIEFQFEGAQWQAGNIAIHVNSGKAIFTPSPTCDLWLPTKRWANSSERSVRDKYMTSKTKEDVLAFHRVTKEPSSFEILLEIAPMLSKETVLDECAHWLIRIPPAISERLGIFGCCDIVEPIFIPELKTTLLMPEIFQIMSKVNPAAYPQLGERFDDIHPLLFGSKLLCEKLIQALGKEATLRTAGVGANFAVIRFDPNCDMKSAKARASGFLINEK